MPQDGGTTPGVRRTDQQMPWTRHQGESSLPWQSRPVQKCRFGRPALLAIVIQTFSIELGVDIPSTLYRTKAINNDYKKESDIFSKSSLIYNVSHIFAGVYLCCVFVISIPVTLNTKGNTVN